MFRFFRKIRYKLTQDNQFFKYVKYALGEIVLVVLGILIALYINNWNEDRKEQERLDLALMDVERELVANISRCRESLGFFFYCDSIVNRILYDGLTIEDYENQENITGLSNIAVWYDGPAIQDESFKTLKEKTGDRSKIQDSIISELSELYIEKKNGVEVFSAEAHRTVMENRKMYSAFDWYKDWWITGEKNKEMIEFLVNDQRHESAVINFSSIVLENFRRLIEDFEISALRSYHRIHRYLAQNHQEHQHPLNFSFNLEDFQHYSGRYVPYENSTVFDMISDSVVIVAENDKIMYRLFYNKGRSFQTEIIPVDNYKFRTKRGAGFYHLVIDDKGQAKEMIYSNGKYRVKTRREFGQNVDRQ